MKKWQKEYLSKHIDELVENTICTTGLLAKLKKEKMLDKYDVDKLDAKAENFAKNMLLYEILGTRGKAYGALLSVLRSCRQNEAYKILAKGVYLHGIPELYVSLSGNMKQIKELLLEDEILSLVKQLKGTLSEHQFLDVCLKESDEESQGLQLVPENLPPSLPYYIPRWISNRVQIDPKFFKEDCADVFVFKGINHLSLSQLAAPNITSFSSRHILKPNSSRFILLECDEDWDDICQMKSHGPVHLVNFDKDEKIYLLEGTSGESQHLHKFLIRKEKEQKHYLTEEDFIERQVKDTTSSGVCICDTPGMGKTVLLASLARQISHNHDGNIVSFIRLHEFSTQLSKWDPNSDAISFLLEQICVSPSHKLILTALLSKNAFTCHLFFDGFDEIRDHKTENSTKTFFQSIVKSGVKIKIYVTSRLHMKKELEHTLGVISYDILPFNNSNQIDFLVKFWKQKIERFQETSLKKFAGLCLQKVREDLRESDRSITGTPLLCLILAEVYLKEAKLACRSAKSSYHPASNMTTYTSIFKLYERFFEVKFNPNDDVINQQLKHQKFKDFHVQEALRLLAPDILNDMVTSCNLSVPEILSYGVFQVQVGSNRMEFSHATFAEFLVAGYLAEIFIGHRLCNKEDETWKIKAFKFFNEQILFHNTYVNFYYTGIIEVLRLNRYGLNQLEYIKPRTWAFTTIYPWMSFKKSVLSWFLNGHLESKIGDRQIDFLESQEPQSYTSLKPNVFYNIFLECVAQSLHYIFTFFHQILKQYTMDDDWENLKTSLFHESIIGHSVLSLTQLGELGSPVHRETSDIYKTRSYFLLCSAVMNSDLKMVENCVNIFRDCFEYDFCNISEQIPTHIMTPLHLAAIKTNYELVEYFVNRISLAGRQILYTCVAHTHGESEEKIARRIAICKLLLSKDPSIIDEEAKEIDCNTLLIAPLIHSELIKFLVVKGVSVNITRTKPFIWNQYLNREMNIVMIASTYMSSSEFHELVVFLLDQTTTREIFNPTNHMFPLNFILQNNDSNENASQQKLELETLTLILDSNPSIKINTNDEYGDSLLYSAVISAQPDAVIKELVKRGGDFNVVNHLGETMLHLAARFGSSELVRFFYGKDLCIAAEDNNGNKPLHSPFRHYTSTTEAFKKIRILIQAGSDIYATNKKGNTFVHKAARRSSEFPDIVRYCVEELKEVGLFTVKNNRGFTPLRLYLEKTFRKIDEETVRTLLHIPSYDVNEVNENGDNLIFSFVGSYDDAPNFFRILDILIQTGINLNNINHDGKNIIHIAVMRSRWGNPADTVQYFLKRKVDPNIRDKKGNTPLDLAMKEKQDSLGDAGSKQHLESERVVSILQHYLKERAS